MARSARFALALAVVLVLAGAVPAVGDRMGTGETVSAAETAWSVGETPAEVARKHSENETSDGESTVNEENESVVIDTDGFTPDYDPQTVLSRVERLRNLSALQGITLHEYDEERGSEYDMRDEFGSIRPIGAQTLQLYSNASTERRQPLGYAVQRQAAVHIYLMNASDVESYGVSQEVVLAHELVHALQFQHDLLTPSRKQFRSEFQQWTTDSRLVTTALVEGDAMWVTEQYFARYGDGTYSVEDYNRSLARSAWPHSVAGMPYYYGYEFYESSGSSPVERSAAIQAPPNSTAELLHPDERFERALAPRPPDIPESEKLTRYHSDIVGELVIRHSLRINDLSFARAAEVADGWSNGRMYYYAAAGASGPATHWVTVWENQNEAREFATAWRSMLDANGAREVGDTLSVPASDQAPGMHYVVEREGETVRITAAERRDTTERLVEAARTKSESNVQSASANATVEA
jgi:hypothetical protein